MRAAMLSFVCGASLLVAAPSALATPAQSQGVAKPSDQTIDERIEQRLGNDSSLKKFNIDVSVDNGVATLTGTVATNAEHARAGRLAMVTGVTRVNNQLVVNRSATGTSGVAEKTKEGVEKAADKTKEGTNKAIDKTKEGTDKVVDKTKEGLSKTGEVITDAWITGRVHMRFIGEDLLKDSDIKVDTKDHVVTLTGTVMSAAGRARAVAIAKDTEGVHNVIDRVLIGPKAKN